MQIPLLALVTATRSLRAEFPAALTRNRTFA
jgi:hypothetical protein